LRYGSRTAAMIARSEGVVFILGLAAGCTDPGEVPVAVPRMGIVASVRTVDGRPSDAVVLPDASVVAGSGDDAEVDSQSLAYFFELTPGRAPVFGLAAGHAQPGAAPQIQSAGLSACDLRFTEVTSIPLADGIPFADGPTGLPMGGLLSVRPDQLVVEDEPDVALEGVSFDWRWVDPALRTAIPGDQQFLRNDDQVSAMETGAAFYLYPTDAEGRRVQFAEEERASVTVVLPAGDPLFSNPEPVFLASWSRGRAFWGSSGAVVFDEAAGTATFDITTFGWFALAVEVPEQTCVPGKVQSEGKPLSGVEVRSLRSGTLGVDRVTSDEAGSVCVPVGGSAAWSALGFDATLESMYTGSGQLDFATGFVLDLDRWQDEDGDSAFEGPGGDCDDSDVTIAPNLFEGDGSWCGGDW
jgi:hypothetical protein